MSKTITDKDGIIYRWTTTILPTGEVEHLLEILHPLLPAKWKPKIPKQLTPFNIPQRDIKIIRLR